MLYRVVTLPVTLGDPRTPM